MTKLKITLKNGRYCEYQKHIEYNNWHYDGNVLIIKKNGNLVAVYNLNNIICVTEKKEY